MAKQEKKVTKPKPVQKKVQAQTAEEAEEERDEFDFGGLPKNVSLKRNIGCGG